MTTPPNANAKKVSATDFKTHCLKLLDEVAESGREMLVTKRGEPVARLAPLRERAQRKLPKSLEGTVTYRHNIVKPVMEPFCLDEDGSEVWNDER